MKDRIDELVRQERFSGSVLVAHDGKPIFSVQYHPEASPGPHDASYLFARFCDHLRKAT